VVRLSKTKNFPPGVLEMCRDRRGRQIALTESRWDHIIRGHRALEQLEGAVKAAVETADIRRPGNGEGIEVLYGRNLGPAAWLAVVVAFDGLRGTILTAYPQAKEPKEEDRL
jgi:hypothetical protein